MLGVNKSTTNVMARSELGIYPLQERILKRNLTYIRYMDSKPQTSLVWNALKYEETQHNNNCTRSTIFSLAKEYENNLFNLSENGEGTLLEKINEMESGKIRDSVRYSFHEAWKEQLNSFPKADTFKHFKDQIICERYLYIIKNRKKRVSMAKLRLSDHCLMIEEGRHRRPTVPRNERYCPHCPDCVETEEHFLIECPAYEDREYLFEKVQTIAPQFVNLNTSEKFFYLMSQGDDKLWNEIVQKTHSWTMKRLETRKQEQEIELCMTTLDTF